MAIVEIQLNRLGINSLELSTDAVEVSAGTTLHVKITNYGAPTHATLKTAGENSGFTSFTYENLYVDSDSEIRVPILSAAETGSFEMQVICGYGMRRTNFTINVIKDETIPADGDKEGEPDLESVVVPIETPKKITPVIITVNLIAPVLGLILLILWICLPNSVDNIVMAVIMYVIMLIGIVITWRTVR